MADAIAILIKDIQVHLVYLFVEYFLAAVAKITQTQPVTVETGTMILADTGTEQPPYQQNDHRYVSESFQDLELRSNLDKIPRCYVDCDVKTSVLVLKFVFVEHNVHSIDLAWLESSNL